MKIGLLYQIVLEWVLIFMHILLSQQTLFMIRIWNWI